MKSQEYILVGDELLVCVLNKFPKNPFLFESEDDLSLAFYKASLKSKYQNLFKNYPFDKNGVMPYSKKLGEGIDTLRKSHILNYVQFRGYQISRGIDFRFDKFIAGKLNDNQKKKIKNLSNYLKQELKKAA
ncbi:hypothetical protein HYS72_03395 [Candidatus Pacearchaeota archaeon]|nr:hypothetical protein [Candidatus Pacearchaeota archaeon]MBI2056938.1 hypothetical protein [Candidatus Pacearchaeota archaeon]